MTVVTSKCALLLMLAILAIVMNIPAKAEAKDKRNSGCDTTRVEIRQASSHRSNGWFCLSVSYSSSYVSQYSHTRDYRSRYRPQPFYERPIWSRDTYCDSRRTVPERVVVVVPDNDLYPGGNYTQTVTDYSAGKIYTVEYNRNRQEVGRVPYAVAVVPVCQPYKAPCQTPYRAPCQTTYLASGSSFYYGR